MANWLTRFLKQWLNPSPKDQREHLAKLLLSAYDKAFNIVASLNTPAATRSNAELQYTLVVLLLTRFLGDVGSQLALFQEINALKGIMQPLLPEEPPSVDVAKLNLAASAPKPLAQDPDYNTYVKELEKIIRQPLLPPAGPYQPRYLPRPKPPL